MRKNAWLNKNIFAMGVTSFFSDFGHEMSTAILYQPHQIYGSSFSNYVCFRLSRKNSVDTVIPMNMDTGKTITGDRGN